MRPRIALLHYASPPTIGGVEVTIAHQARILTELGYPVRVISGAGSPFDPRIETHIDPLFGSRDARVIAVKHELDQGIVSPACESLIRDQEAALARALDGCAVCIVHNVHTLHKNLPLSAALERLPAPRLIAWVHDVAWTNPQYLPELHDGEPWNVLRRAWTNSRYVTISRARRDETAALLNIAPDSIAVIPPGVDMPSFFQWTDTTRRIVEECGLLDADVLLLLPARLTRRKNIALALEVTAALRSFSGLDYRLIVTGPPGPHNPANPGYLGELLALRESLGLQNAAHFLYELSAVPDDTTMANLYQLADGLFFPSTQEGFGIPILEAGITGLPIFCSNLEVFHESGGQDVYLFDPVGDSPGTIARQVLAYYADNPRHRLRVRVRRDYRWDSIVRSKLIPLLEV